LPGGEEDMNKIRILIVDDQVIVCEGLQTLLKLEPDFEIAGICHNGREALDFCRRLPPDIVLMDTRMPVMDGISATREIVRLFPFIKVLILTTFNEEKLIIEGIKCGARGFLLKDIQPEDLCKSIREVHSGGGSLHPDVTLKLMGLVSSMESGSNLSNLTVSHFKDLTAREKEVLVLIGRGLSNAEIAAALYIVEGTVKNHVSSMLAKLELRDRTQLAILAQKNMT
ncbi:MAG: response regulator transcription factor, partial [Syntrophomonas sp.]